MGTSDQNHPALSGEVENQNQSDDRLYQQQNTSGADGTAATGADALHLVMDGVAPESTPPVADHHLADNDLVAAIAVTSPDTLVSIEHTLDQLTTATDLFDVPAVDFDSGTGS
jgi:hypothetical protein